MDPEKNKKPVDTDELLEEIIDARTEGAEQFDPAGSWTGVPEDENEQPVQDADDL